MVLNQPQHFLPYALLFTFAFGNVGCAFSHKIQMVPQVSHINVSQKLPASVALLITPEVRNSVIRKRPSTFVGWAHVNEYPMGKALEEASLQAFSQVFERVTVVRNLEDAKANYWILIEPVVEQFSYYHSMRWLWNATYSKVRVRVALVSGETKVWELSLNSPRQLGEAKTWFRRLVWDHDVNARKGESASKALAFCLQEIAAQMVQDRRLREVIEKSRGVPPRVS